MAPQPLRPVLSRWETNPPVIHAAEANCELRHVFDAFCDLSILREIAPAAATDCSDCGERCRVEFIADKFGAKHGYVHCRYCGIANVPDDRLKRWEIDSAAFLGAAFSGLKTAVQERVAGQLWQVGKANWAGRSREVWFARAFRRNRVSAAIQELDHRPKAILFAPTEAGAGWWQDATKNLVLALESTLSFDGGKIGFDTAYVESRIVDAGLASGSAANRRFKRRAGRAAKIELLTKELVAHLRSARDHAFAKKEQTGEPELLPRPTQKALGERVGLSESDVSRCLNDPDARELQLYWNTADDLNQLMSWKGPIAKGRRA